MSALARVQSAWDSVETLPAIEFTLNEAIEFTAAYAPAMDADEFREVANKAIGSSSLRAWCEANDVRRANTSDYLACRRAGPPESLLAALGFRWAIVRK